MVYKVIAAVKTKDVQLQHGLFHEYMLTLEDNGAQLAATMLQKPETPAPKVGDSLEGEITKTEYGNKFKRAQAGFGGKGFSRSPEEQRSIIRQHSQGVAVEFLGLLDNSKRSEPEMIKLVFALTDKFELDATYPKPSTEKAVETKFEGKEGGVIHVDDASKTIDMKDLDPFMEGEE